MKHRIQHLLYALLPLITTRSAHGEVVTPPASPQPVVVAAPEPIDGHIPSDWWQSVQSQITREEYHVSPAPGGLQAPNRAHDLRTYFRPRGIEVFPRRSTITDAPPWRFSWRTTGWGRAHRMHAVDETKTEPKAEGARVVYARHGFDEWYENKPEGVEQGFTVHLATPGESPLRIEGRVEGALRAMLLPEGDVDFIDAHGARLLRYGSPRASDAAGRALPVRLSIEEGHRVAILIEDRGARYPITIDPLLTTPAWTAEGDQVIAAFGWSVATAGDVNRDGYSDVVVGAQSFDNGQTDEGRAFVYYGSANGLSLTPKWTAESDQASAVFGASVAGAGDVNGDGFGDVIVGARSFDNGQTDEGRAFVYYGSSTGPSLAPSWTAEGDQATAIFGYSVASAGDVNGDGFSDVVIGALLFDNGQSNEGRAFVYHGSVTGLSPTPNWTAESDQASAGFGVSVASAGDVNGDGFADVIVGANTFDNGQTDEGRAFVYHGSASGLSLTPNWTAESNQASANFGVSVGTAGDVNGDGFSDVIVGARWFSNPESQEGRAFVYHGSASGLHLAFDWSAESNQVAGEFAGSVATAGDVNGDGFADVIVGGRYLHNGETNEGRAFVYYGSTSGLSPTANWTAESNQNDAEFGICVATAGDVNGDGFSDVIVGAWRFDNGQNDEGRAFVYLGAASGLSVASNWTSQVHQSGASMAADVATAGDVNGDGFSDVIVGAPYFDNGQTDEGRVFVYHGSASGLSLTPNWTAESDQTNYAFGLAVAGAGDVNGDGYSDVIVGAPRVGLVYVFHGSAAGLSLAADWTAEQDTALFGQSVAAAGDVNGDGFGDVIVGASLFTNGQTREGRTFVYHGSASGLSLTPNWTAESDQAYANFGYAVAGAGDVNGDGYSDVIVGAYVYNNGVSTEGRAFVYHGSGSGLSLTPSWTAGSDQAGARFGSSVGTAGDVNGDGFADVIVAAPLLDNGPGQADEGRAFVYHGSASGLSLTPNWTAESNQGGAQFGKSVGTAGDVNGDGFSDVVVGASTFDNGETDEGRAFVYHGSASGLSVIPNWTAESNQVGAFFGHSVATAGDVNGDGYSDVIVGASGFDGDPMSGGQTDEGRAFLYYGNGADGLDYSLRQLRADGSAPIALLGRSDSPRSFGIDVLKHSASGLKSLSIFVEVKRFGFPFDGAGIVQGPITSVAAPPRTEDVGAPSVDGSGDRLTGLVTGLNPGTLYHWRLRIVSDSPYFPHTRWLSLPGNSVTEADLRTGPSETDVGFMPGNSRVWLEANAPNPFAVSTRIGYTLPERAPVRLAVYDIAGREVALLVDGPGNPGRHEVLWDGLDARGVALRNGVYFARLQFAGRSETRKIVFAR